MRAIAMSPSWRAGASGSTRCGCWSRRATRSSRATAWRRLAQRLASARRVADGRRVVATAIESQLGTRFTIDTLRLLQRQFPRVEFVWIAGADIFEQLPRWRNWRRIARCVRFAILPRPGYNRRALAGCAAAVLRGARWPARAATVLVRRAPPAWVFLTAPQHAASASAIRATASAALRVS